MKNDLENEVDKKDKKLQYKQVSISFLLYLFLLCLILPWLLCILINNYCTWHNKCFLIDWLIDWLITTTGFELTTYPIKPEHLAHWAMGAVGDSGLKVRYKLAHLRYTPS